MKKGDMVRFRAVHWLGGAGLPVGERPWLTGLLLEYHKWEKIATILYKDEVVRVAVRNVQKYGRGFQKQL
ncbi:MAG TPA: hypothetical protein EYQ00_09450 [Dehalococcoidia bacterium]|jgi:hypothetical protein|nr:hypothetical protein [Dehalococcoidia bacterium]